MLDLYPVIMLNFSSALTNFKAVVVLFSYDVSCANSLPNETKKAPDRHRLIAVTIFFLALS